MKNAKLLVVALIVAAILSVSAVGAAEISLNGFRRIKKHEF